MLTKRQLEVVLSVVYEYIKSGDSVGSRTVSKRYLPGRSSATIRNEMSDLEEMGYLRQTHTSSGRIPTTRGFRLYVDTLLSRMESQNDGTGWVKNLEEHKSGLEGALAFASEMLSRISNYVGVAAITPLDAVRFQRVDFVRVDERNVLMLVVLQGGLLHHKTVAIPYDMSQDYLDDLARRVNMFAGYQWTEVKSSLVKYILSELSEYREACKSAIRELEGVMIAPAVKVFTGSMSHMLNLPDFQDLGRIQTLFSFLEQEESMAALLERCSLDGKIKAVIGDENDDPALKKSSFVAVSTVANGQKAMIGVIGPERMDYERVVTAINEVLENLEP